MPRPQIRRRRDKPTSSVGRDESINHGIVIPHAERLRARRPATLSFIFAGCWKVLGKYSVLAYSKNDSVSPPIVFNLSLYDISIFFPPSFSFRFSRRSSSILASFLRSVSASLSMNFETSHAQRISSARVASFLSFHRPSVEINCASRRIISRVTVYGLWKRFIALYDRALLTILRFDSPIRYAFLCKYPWARFQGWRRVRDACKIHEYRNYIATY